MKRWSSYCCILVEVLKSHLGIAFPSFPFPSLCWASLTSKLLPCTTGDHHLTWTRWSPHWNSFTVSQSTPFATNKTHKVASEVPSNAHKECPAHQWHKVLVDRWHRWPGKWNFLEIATQLHHKVSQSQLNHLHIYSQSPGECDLMCQRHSLPQCEDDQKDPHIWERYGQNLKYPVHTRDGPRMPTRQTGMDPSCPRVNRTPEKEQPRFPPSTPTRLPSGCHNPNTRYALVNCRLCSHLKDYASFTWGKQRCHLLDHVLVSGMVIHVSESDYARVRNRATNVHKCNVKG